ncbi:MAG TPA: ABC transporter permease [Gammaproteobacteria bacterium]|nr:ABC transporter permease [Gammaproteobacteria bacterium]
MSNILVRIGKNSTEKALEFYQFLEFIGELALTFIRLLKNPKNFPYRSIVSVIETTGVNALPLIGLLSFLIGVTLTYQMGLQLKNYGANIFVVDLLGLSILREFAPLITAIIVAGRSGSAFTAQLGTMKIREEIDALRTMGITPSEILILPKLIGLIIVLPLLAVWSIIFALLGGMVVSNAMLHVGYYDFLHRFYEAIPVRYFYTGMIKTPVFGFLIAAIGCFRGLQVSGSAESVGTETTKSVVQSIFFVIVFDAAFSVLFSWLKL